MPRSLSALQDGFSADCSRRPPAEAVAEPWKEYLAVAVAMASPASVEDRPTMQVGVVMEEGVVVGTAVDEHGEDFF